MVEKNIVLLPVFLHARIHGIHVNTFICMYVHMCVYVCACVFVCMWRPKDNDGCLP